MKNTNKALFITICISIFCINVFSQNGKKLSDSEKAVFEQKMLEKSKQIKTLHSDFVQTKTSSLVAEKSVSKGILYYQSPSSLRWEYSEPTPSTLILNGNNAALLDKSGKRVGNEKMLKQLGWLIINVINGESLKNSKQFSTEIYENGGQILVVLTPIQKRLKEFYSTIELKIDRKTFLANEITMNEKSGDRMVIYLNNKKLDEVIDSKNFEIK
jgi:outer membrane lipoprotein-sorting protein